MGTATTILRLGEFTLLTDPNFLHAGQRAYLGYGLSSRRRTEPALTIGQLPRLDAVLLSHLHGDHFDRTARRGLPKTLPVLTTPQAERRLRRWGFAQAAGLPTWDSYELAGAKQRLRITAVPGRHGPALIDRLLPDVMGTIVDLEEQRKLLLRLYITGDTLLHLPLRDIPARFPDIDAMLIHLGGTRLLGLLLTMDARQGNILTRFIRPRMTVPIHYDDYPVFRSPLADYLALARREHGPEVHPITRGRTLTLPTRAWVA